MEFKKYLLKDKRTAVNCRTQQEAIDFLNWASKHSDIDNRRGFNAKNTHWSQFSEDTHYCIALLEGGNKLWIESEKLKAISFAEAKEQPIKGIIEKVKKQRSEKK